MVYGAMPSLPSPAAWSRPSSARCSLDNQLMLFGSCAVVLVVSILIALPMLRDRVLDRQSKPREPLLRVAFGGYWFNPKDAPDFS